MGIIPKALAKVFVDEYDYSEENEPKSYFPRELGKIMEISVTEIRANPSQPRRIFNADELTSLAKSISQDGIIQPLTVRKVEFGFELISGERRFRAAKMTGLRLVPCIVVNADMKRSAIMALVENIQREDLTFFEQARAIEKLISMYQLTQDEIAVRLGMAQSTVANKLRLLRLSEDEQAIICDNNLTERHARALLRINDVGKRKEILIKIVNGGWTVGQTEKYIEKRETEEIRKKSIRKSSVMLKDVRLFINTVNKAIDVMKLAGVDANSKRVDHEDYIEYIIKIPQVKDSTPQE